MANVLGIDIYLYELEIGWKYGRTEMIYDEVGSGPYCQKHICLPPGCSSCTGETEAMVFGYDSSCQRSGIKRYPRDLTNS